MVKFTGNIPVLGLLLQKEVKHASSVFILTDEKVGTHCLPLLIAECRALAKTEVIEVEAGERSKSIEVCMHIWQHLLEAGADRQALLINVGGGVVTDLGGFIASTYKRGIRSIHIPTSLLAMVDAAIGGKTGIDHSGFKNVVGTFYPAHIYICPDFLNTLENEQLLSGLAEMLKISLVSDPVVWNSLVGKSTPGIGALSQYIEPCVKMKEEIVAADPMEDSSRKLLNLGHTIGHAIESWCLSKEIEITHGHCVAVGIMLETRISVEMGHSTEQVYQSVLDGMSAFFPPSKMTVPDFGMIASYLVQDKKNLAGDIRMVLLNEPGKATIDVVTNLALIEKCWNDFFNNDYRVNTI